MKTTAREQENIYRNVTKFPNFTLLHFGKFDDKKTKTKNKRQAK